MSFLHCFGEVFLYSLYVNFCFQSRFNAQFNDLKSLFHYKKVYLGNVKLITWPDLCTCLFWDLHYHFYWQVNKEKIVSAVVPYILKSNFGIKQILIKGNLLVLVWVKMGIFIKKKRKKKGVFSRTSNRNVIVFKMKYLC